MTFQIVSRGVMQARGAAAFDSGLGHDDHGLPPEHPAIDAWQLGWRQRRDQVVQERYGLPVRPQTQLMRAEP